MNAGSFQHLLCIIFRGRSLRDQYAVVGVHSAHCEVPSNNVIKINILLLDSRYTFYCQHTLISMCFYQNITVVRVLLYL